MSLAKYAFCILLLVGLAGCTKPAQENAAQQQPAGTQQMAAPVEQQQTTAVPEAPPEAAQQPAPQPAPQPRPQPAPAAKAVKSTPKPSSVAPAAVNAPAETPAAAPAAVSVKTLEPRFATIEDGTKIQVRLQDALDSSVNQSGDTFQAILDKDIIVDGLVVAPRGSVLDGRLSNVSRSGRVEGRASMSLQLTSMTVGNQTYPLQTEILSFQAESTKKQDATKVGVGAGLGAVIGAIAGGGKGAAIGAAVGAGAGGATVVATRGKEVKFEAEHAFSFVLRNGISVKLK